MSGRPRMTSRPRAHFTRRSLAASTGTHASTHTGCSCAFSRRDEDAPRNGTDPADTRHASGSRQDRMPRSLICKGRPAGLRTELRLGVAAEARRGARPLPATRMRHAGRARSQPLAAAIAERYLAGCARDLSHPPWRAREHGLRAGLRARLRRSLRGGYTARGGGGQGARVVCGGSRRRPRRGSRRARIFSRHR